MQEEENVLKQGKTYEPVGEAKEEEVEDTTSSESKPSILSSDLLHNKGVLIGAIALVVIILIFAGVFMLTGNKDKSGVGIGAEEDIPDFLKELEEGELGENADYRYTDREREMLRQAGYTGYEIEEFEANLEPYSLKIEESEQLRKEIYEREVLPYFDGASDKFKELYNNTWLSGKEVTLNAEEAGTWSYNVYTYNADYDKVHAKGHQLYIKITLGDGEPAFMLTDPTLYSQLADSGNIVVSITYVDTGTSKLITNIEPIEIE